jgi:hypothetical protein
MKRHSNKQKQKVQRQATRVSHPQVSSKKQKKELQSTKNQTKKDTK